MRLTLMEVLGEEAGTALYSPQWLLDRVRWHLSPDCCTGEIYVAVVESRLIGHSIVRVDKDEEGSFGLFSTTFVTNEERRKGVAGALIRRNEAWMRQHSLTRAATDTSDSNTRLIRLFRSLGYSISHRDEQSAMVRLSCTMSACAMS